MMIRNAERHVRPSRRNSMLSCGAVSRRVAAVLLLAVLAGQPACLFKKKKAAAPEAAPAGPARIVVLPLNAGSDGADLHWISLAVPVLMTRLGSATPSLELVPLWQSMPIAVESAGASRTLTPEAAAYVASRMAARWAVHGEVTQEKDGITILVDFVPTKSTSFPFRYNRTTSVGSLRSSLLEACNQFLFYLISKPIPEQEGKDSLDPALLREVAEAVDREHGWFVQADPGKSVNAVAGLARRDRRLAPLVFNPSLYPELAAPSAVPRAGQPSSYPPKAPPPAPKPPSSDPR